MRDKHDHNLANLYHSKILTESDEVIEELLEPKVRSKVGAVVDKVAGAMGGKTAGARNKLVEVYKSVWKEYEDYRKTRKGLGATGEYEIPDAIKILKQLGIKDNNINQAITDSSVTPTGSVSKEDMGSFIYKSLQLHYDADVGYMPKYKLPTKL